MNYEIYIVESIEIVGSIRISWRCDGIYESYVIAPIVPIIPIISIMGRYRHKKKRVLTRSNLCAAHFYALLSEDARMAPLGVAFRGFVCVLISKNYIYILPYEKPCIRFF